nr:PREDICTED: uncharacterized protein LOC109031017 [Bemisia tabaci]
MWCVAIFCDNGDIRIVCQKWLVESTEGNVRCWYPTAIDGNKWNRLLAENTGPDQENWEMVAIEILKDKIGTLIDARKIAKKAEDEETSLSLTEPENMGRGRRKKKSSQRVLSLSSSDEENPSALSTVSKRSRRQEEPPRSLLRIQSLKWPTSCIDKAGRLPFSDLNQISRPQGVASSTQKPPPSSSNAPKTTHKTGTPQPPSHFQNSNQVKGFAASTQKPPPSSSNAPKTTHKTGTPQPPSQFQNSYKVQGFAASTQKPTPSSSHAATTTDKTGPVPITSQRKNYPKVQIPNSKTSTHSSAAHYAPPPSTNFDPRVLVDRTSAGEIIQKLANFQEQLNRIEKITVQTASKVVALSNVSGDVPTALIEIQSKLSDLLLVENNRLRDEILQNLPINDDMALNEFEAKLIDPKFRSAFIKFMATKGSTKNVSLCVKKLMKELLVDTFAINYCMTGHLGKKPFMDNRNLFESIAAATRSFHPP